MNNALLLAKKKKQDGLQGELSNSEFISYQGLLDLVGFSQGILINEGTGWLKLNIDGIDLVMAKNNILKNVSYDMLAVSDLVYGETQVEIAGKTYKVRLPRGADSDPGPNITDAVNPVGTRNSEWSKIFFPLVRDDTTVPAENRDPSAPYTKAQLGITVTPMSWCMEKQSDNAARAVIRGYSGVGRYVTWTTNAAGSSYGWRPVLEEV